MRLRERLADVTNYIFGSTSAIITNTSLIVGLGSSHAGRIAILGSLLTIAVADNISDSLGIHMYKEAEGQDTRLSLFSMALNFTARFLISCSFIAVVLTLPAQYTETVAVIWGLLLLIVISYFISRKNRDNTFTEIVKHLIIAISVIAASHFVGQLIARHFNL
jgi:VIT1/CCC1 family predicted Fe2+/Mn2+ transporter